MHLVAERNFKEGDEFVWNYSSIDNNKLLLHFGFIDPNNPNDCVPMFTNGDYCTGE